MLLHDSVFHIVRSFFVYFSKSIFVILTKKKKEYLILYNMLFPLKTEESTSQLKDCDAKLKGPVIWQPAARYSLRVR